jgi:hypothetical protein
MRNLLLKDNAASLAKHNPLTGAYAGTSWASATMRAGCQDHLLHPGRRGNRLIPHPPPISMLSAAPREASAQTTKAGAKKGGGAC